MTKITRMLNDYFFDVEDVEEDEQADMTSAALFYGVCGLGALIILVIGTLYVLN